MANAVLSGICRKYGIDLDGLSSHQLEAVLPDVLNALIEESARLQIVQKLARRRVAAYSALIPNPGIMRDESLAGFDASDPNQILESLIPFAPQ